MESMGRNIFGWRRAGTATSVVNEICHQLTRWSNERRIMNEAKWQLDNKTHT